MVYLRISPIFLFITIFVAVSILLGFWIGLFFLNAWLILGISALISFFLVKRFPLEEKIPPILWVLGILLLVLLYYPVVLSNGFPLSADAVPTTALRVLETKIPETFFPYSEVSYGYQTGFPLLGSLLKDVGLGFFLSDYLIVWFLAGLAGVAELVLVFLLTRHFFESEKAGLLAAFVFFSSKFVFENQYHGEYQLILANCFLLLGWLLWRKKNPLFLLCFPTVIAIHPSIALNMVFLFAMIAIVEQKRVKEMAVGLAAGLLALPAIVVTYVPILINAIAGSGGGGSSISHRLVDLLNFFRILPAWVGIMLFVLFIAGLFLAWRKEGLKKIIHSFREISLLLLGSFVLFLIFSFAGLIGVARMVELIALLLVLATAGLLSRIEWIQKNQNTAFALLLVIGLVGFFSSSYLGHLREGSKIRLNDAQFAQEFFSFDPEPKKTLFLTNSRGKMAEFSNKIPFDANADWFLPNLLEMKRNAAFEEFKKNHALQEKILNEQCLDCIPLEKLEYVVVDNRLFSKQLPFKTVLEKENLSVYDLSEPE